MTVSGNTLIENTSSNASGKPQRIAAIDLLRALPALVIVFYHFGCTVCDSGNPLWNMLPRLVAFKNCDFGDCSVEIFFMISGAVLYYNHKSISLSEVPGFYLKRWIAIFPSFLMVWGYIYFMNVISIGSFFYIKPEASIILSVFGLDGYFSYLTPTYYSVGEWFLGALVLLYLLYPLIVRLFRNKIVRIITTAVLLFLEILILSTDFFIIIPYHNLITCLLSFWLGMLFIRYRRFLTGRVPVIISAVVMLIYFLIPLPFDNRNILKEIIFSAAAFIVLFSVASFLQPKLEGTLPDRFVRFTSKISYQMFLLQHVIIAFVLSHFSEKTLNLGEEILLLIVVYAAVFIFSTVLKCVNDSLIGYFKKKMHKERLI